jgi:transcriptional regulator
VENIYVNAFDFLDKAIEELWNEKNKEEIRLKYSTINFYEGLELLYKSRLFKEHMSLIIKNVDTLKSGDIENGNFTSIGMKEVFGRLETVLNIKENIALTEAMDDLKKARNRYVHFHCKDSKGKIISIQLKAWDRMFETKTKFLSHLNKDSIYKLIRLNKKMKEHKDYIEGKFEMIKRKIMKISDSEIVLTCPKCEKEAVVNQSGSLCCMVCDNLLIEYSDMIYSVKEWMSKNGVKDEMFTMRPGYCFKCDNYSIINTTDTRYEKNGKKYYCINCKEAYDNSQCAFCVDCETAIFGMDNQKSGKVKNCLLCGWHADSDLRNILNKGMEMFE